MLRTEIKQLFAAPEQLQEGEITVGGWVRTIRTSKELGFHPIGHIYLMELGEKAAQGESGRELVWLPVEECRKKMVLDYQSWAVEMSWELYQKRKKENQL